MKLTIALAQMNTCLGNVKANLEKHLALIDKAKAGGAELVIFPELSLTGYYLQDIAATVAHRPTSDDPIFRPLLEASQDLDIMVGFVDEDDRRRFYISAAYLSKGEVLHVHHKVYLPTYALFDEGRYFAWGDSVRAFDTRFGRVGMLVCEDFWHMSPPYLLWLDGADLMLFQSASPGRGLSKAPFLASFQSVNLMTSAYAGLFTSFVAHTNRVGFEDGLNFFGGSAVYDPDGHQVAEAPFMDEALVLAELDINQLQRSRTRLPLLRDERTNLMLRELQRIVDSQITASPSR
jgi:NAD+ synthase (glutamine-hydrolysing)